MLHEYRDIITHMKQNHEANAHFLNIFDKHNDLDNKITEAEKGAIPMTDMEIENLKKQKLQLKDEAYSIIIKYKKENGL
ncbi:MAG: YdcH family protein [Sulfurimonadaceae bacterium]|nr:YdcH family protein [Sulfurimonadaceae bacterium]